RRLAEIDGLARLRYTTSHPRDMDEDLIAAHGEVPALMPYLHLPVQSGADDILQAMNRRHTAADYLKVVEALRQKAPNIALSSDFIVGFPGEGNGEFAATLRLVAEVDYAQAYSFKYSPRPGTPAAAEDEQVPEEIKAERLAMLQDLLNAQQLAFNHRTKGQVLSVLFDRPGRRPDQLVGRSPYMQAVHVAAPAVTAERIMGQILPVRIEEAHANSLAGSVELPLAADPVVSGPRPVDARSFAGQSL
ncbi:MAG TPA: radical SAM protein, partial [Kiloniellaceae bacterium]|nr:radical SAM protein [Kiloniellaceae bacterium]